MNYWTDPRTWKGFWKIPHFEWWVLPSGGDCQTSWSNFFFDFWLEAPLGAHALGAAIGFALGYLFSGNVGGAIIASAVWTVVGQLQKADALLPLKRYNGREIFWRCIIGLGTMIGLACVF